LWLSVPGWLPTRLSGGLSEELVGRGRWWAGGGCPGGAS
jgi:hypothetical protein